MIKKPPDLFNDIYGHYPNTGSAEYRVFCLALYVASKERNQNATTEHKELLKKKYPKVLPVIDQLRMHAAATANKENKDHKGERYGNLSASKRSSAREVAKRY